MCKNLTIAAKGFQDLGYRSNLDINEETYIVAYLATWLSVNIIIKSSTVVRPETFLMAVKMARGYRYSLVIPYLAWAY